MRTNAIIRIVIFSLIVLILLGILLTGMGIGTFMFDLGAGSGEYITGEGSVNASEVHELEVEWAAGSIKIETADTDTISFTEAGQAKESERMVYELRNGTLKIQYSKPGIKIGFGSYPSKDLTIVIPEGWNCKELSIDSAASTLDISGLTAENVQLNMAAGEGVFQACRIDDLDIDTAAGEITYSGELNTLDSDAAAGSITLVLTNVPAELDIDGAAVELDLTLPADCGFRVDTDGLATDFTSDFATTTVDECHVYGDGRCNISVDGAGSEIRIRKGQ